MLIVWFFEKCFFLRESDLSFVGVYVWKKIMFSYKDINDICCNVCGLICLCLCDVEKLIYDIGNRDKGVD